MGGRCSDVRLLSAEYLLQAAAEGKVLGRLATEIATVLMGKHRQTWTPHVLSGDFVVITNASKIVMTGSKLDTKSLRRYSGYPGGQKVETYRTILEKDPCRVVREAVTRMLPRGPLGRRMAAHLKVYAGAEHPHQAQSPQVLEIA